MERPPVGAQKADTQAIGAQMLELWVECLQRLLEDACQAKYVVTAQGGRADASRVAAPAASGFRMRFDGDAQTEVVFYIDDAARLQILQLLSGIPLDAAAGLSLDSESLWEQTLARLAEQWSDALRGLGRQLSLEDIVAPGVIAPVSVSANASVPARWQMQSGASLFTFELSIATAPVEVPARVELHSPGQIETPAGARAPSQYRAGPSDEAEEANRRLLLDVELFATLRFGTREMPLREILELCPGDVIALDRAVHAPVDLIVGDRIVARGEVVVVDGNYGLRVQEIARPKERLEGIRCLF